MPRTSRRVRLLALFLLLLPGPGVAPLLGADQAGTPVVTEPGRQLLSGRFHTVFEDDFSAPERSRARYFLIDDRGTWAEVSIAEEVLAGVGGPSGLRGRQVRAVVERQQAGPTEVLSLAPLEAPGRGTGRLLEKAAAAKGALFGAQPYASLACKFQDINQTPQNIGYIDGLMSSTYPGLDHYWQEISSGRINLAGSVQLGWYRLPGPLSTYYDAQLGIVDIDLLLADCVAEADPDVYFPDFAGINVMVNDPLANKALGGSATLTVDGVAKTYGVTWLPDWAWQNQRTTAHEMGHSFGWPHSSGPYGLVYDSRWDVMSGGYSGPIDPDYGSTGCGTIAFHHDLAGWIEPLRKFVAPADSAATVTLERLDQPVDPNAYLMVEIAADPDTTYTVEARKQVGYDSGIPAEGVVIHDVSYQAVVVDADGDGDPNDEGAVWVPGETFTDAANGVSVTVDSDTGTGYVITVARGPQTPLPNLALGPVSGAAVCAPGGLLGVSGETFNLGGGGTDSNYSTGVYLSSDGVITDDDWLLANLGRSPLGAGLSDPWGGSFSVPDYVPTGTYTLGAFADRGEQINETDEADNTRAGNTVVVDYFAPDAVTDPATGVTSTQATLEGTVNALGQSATSWFEWGPTTSYGSTTSTTQLSAGCSDLPVSATVSGLVAGTTYHFRVASQNATGTSYGADRTFVPSQADVDLVVTAVSGPSSAAVGTVIHPSATVLNQGTAPTDVFRTGIYLAEDPLLSGPATSCGGGPIVDGLLGGESKSRSFNCSIPTGLAPGTYYLVARADDNETVAEVDETNNTLSAGAIEITQADLVISSVSSPSVVAANATVSVSNAVENVGAGDAISFRVGIYLSTDQVIDGTDTLLGDRVVSSLGFGLTDSASTDVTIPPSTPTGVYYVGAVADFQDSVPESDEANNSLAGNSVGVTNDLPDLVVTMINAPTSISAGSLLSGQVTVKNQGGSSTLIGGTIAMYLSEDTVIDSSDRFLGNLYFPELWSGQSYTQSYKVGVTIDTPRGRYWVGAIVDSTGAVAESDETNNTGTATESTRVK